MKRWFMFLIVLVAGMSLAQDEIKADEDGWTNLEFLNGLVKFRSPFDLEDNESAECPPVFTNEKDQVKTSFYVGKDEKIACAVAIFESDSEKLKLDINSKSHDDDDEDSWFKVVKSAHRTSKKGGWTCISGDVSLKNGGSVFMRLFYNDHQAVAFAVFCQDAKDTATKKTKKQILDSFVFDIKADSKE